MQIDHSCFVALPQGAAHSLKSTELRDGKYSDVAVYLDNYIQLKLDRIFRKTLYIKYEGHVIEFLSLYWFPEMYTYLKKMYSG
jgi:hypothetical protein